MVEFGVVLGHVFAKGKEIDKTKVDIIQSLPDPQTIGEVRSFLWYFEFSDRCIKEFSKIASPICDLLAEDACFYFNEDCMNAFDEFNCFLDGKNKYIHVLIAPDDKEKTIFTCSFGTYALRRMSFGLCNALTTFQICMMSIFLALPPKLWKFSWMILLFMVILLMSACFISL